MASPKYDIFLNKLTEEGVSGADDAVVDELSANQQIISGDLIQLSGEVLAIEGVSGSLELSARVDVLETQVDTLSAQVNILETQVDELSANSLTKFQTIVEATSPYLLTPANVGNKIVFNDLNEVILQLPGGLGYGFNCDAMNELSGQISISAVAGATLFNSSSHTKSASAAFAAIAISSFDTDRYNLIGETDV